jgi:hypothetical protein
MRRQFCHKKQIRAYTDQIVAIVAIVFRTHARRHTTHADCIDGVRGTRSSSASARERPMRGSGKPILRRTFKRWIHCVVRASSVQCPLSLGARGIFKFCVTPSDFMICSGRCCFHGATLGGQARAPTPSYRHGGGHAPGPGPLRLVTATVTVSWSAPRGAHSALSQLAACMARGPGRPRAPASVPSVIVLPQYGKY